MQRPTRTLLPVLFGLLLLASPHIAQALAEETFGNAPLNAANYKDWPGIMPMLNHESRVYSVWVNGHETFYYTGNTAALNNELLRVAAADDLKSEIVLRPGPKKVKSIRGEMSFDCDWEIELMGGIAGHLTTLDKGDLVWSKVPVLTIYTGGEIDLKKLEIPQGLKVTRLAALKNRVKQGLASKDQTVRGWTCGVLASLDRYDPESVKALTGMLTDPVEWVRLNAVGSLETFGKKAESALPALRENLNSKDKSLKEAAEKAIATIEAAQEDRAGEKSFTDAILRIDHFLTDKKSTQPG
jgi:hypothetical protein